MYGGGLGTAYLYLNDLTVTNCTFTGNSAAVYGGAVYDGFYDAGATSNLTLTNCILWGNSAIEGPEVAMSNEGTLSINYCCVQGGQSAIYDPNAALIWGDGNIDVDPCFVDADVNDYHLKSEGWRWDSIGQQWDYDDVTSRCVDAGNPGYPLGEELISVPDDPNNERGVNLRVNMGAYGGTSESSMCPHDWASLADLTNDQTVDCDDLEIFVRYWLDSGEFIPSDLSRDESVDFTDFAIFADEWLWVQ
jgi:predicted outer membrane repeat protein